MRGGNYRLSIAMGESFGKTLTSKVGEWFENHLGDGGPLQKEEEKLWADAVSMTMTARYNNGNGRPT